MVNAVTVERNANSETVTIVGFMLTEADGGGVRDLECGIVATEEEARIWKGNSGHRGYRPMTKIITVHRTAQAFIKAEEIARAQSVLSKLSKNDLELLRKHPELLSA
jgi:hypothetical protein